MRKFAENNQAHKQTENSKPEATLIPCGSWGRAGQYRFSLESFIYTVWEDRRTDLLDMAQLILEEITIFAMG